MSNAVQRVSDAIAEARNQWRPGPAPGLENADGKSLFAAEAEAAVSMMQIDREDFARALAYVEDARRGFTKDRSDANRERIDEARREIYALLADVLTPEIAQ